VVEPKTAILPPMDSLLRGRAAETLRRLQQAEVGLHAAAVAYNAFLALVPLALALLGIASVVGQSEASVDRVVRALRPIAPSSVVDFFVELMGEAADRLGGASGLVITLSVLGALVLGSRAIVSLQKATAAVEHEAERRRGIALRLVAMALTVAGGVAMVLTSLTLVAGRRLFDFLANLTGFDAVVDLWIWFRVPVAGAGLYLFLWGFYRFGPPRPMPRAWLAALISSAGIVAGSLLFGFYLSNAPDLGATFGALGAVAIALVWLWVTAAAVLLGAVVVTLTSDGGSASI
jgi:membrane protein